MLPQGVRLNYCYRIYQNLLNFTYAFKCYHQKCKLASLQLAHPVYHSFFSSRLIFRARPHCSHAVPCCMQRYFCDIVSSENVWCNSPRCCKNSTLHVSDSYVRARYFCLPVWLYLCLLHSRATPAVRFKSSKYITHHVIELFSSFLVPKLISQFSVYGFIPKKSVKETYPLSKRCKIASKLVLFTNRESAFE